MSLHEKGLGYSTLNTARSAISTIVLPHNDVTIGSSPIISRFMRRIFKINPPTPRYKTTWDPHIVLNYLSSLATGDNLTLKLLSMKLLMLTALVSAQRGQSLHMLDIRFMKEGETQFDFLLPEHIKQSRPRYKPPSVMLKAYPTDKTLCVVSHMKEYLRRTKPLRGDSTKLFISFMKPHKHISRETLSRWIKTVMEAAGKETSIFHTHSTRAAATSKAKAACVTIQEILDNAGWSSSKTFDRFYNKRASNELTFTNSL